MSEVDHLFPPFASLERKQLAVLPGTSVSIYHGDYVDYHLQTLVGFAFEGDP